MAVDTTGTMQAPPFDRVRERLGLTVGEFAAALGLPYSSCYNACHGLTVIPRKATEALRELGVCPAAIAQEQRQWLEQRGQQRRAELRARLGVG